MAAAAKPMRIFLKRLPPRGTTCLSPHEGRSYIQVERYIRMSDDVEKNSAEGTWRGFHVFVT